MINIKFNFLRNSFFLSNKKEFTIWYAWYDIEWVIKKLKEIKHFIDKEKIIIKHFLLEYWNNKICIEWNENKNEINKIVSFLIEKKE